MRHVILLVAVVLSCATSARGQDSTGTIDTRQSTAEQIRSLEQLIGGDVSADKQAVALRWLADLYTSGGNLDAAANAYERILVFFPRDVATSNAYALFLLEHRHDPQSADKVLSAAIEWGENSTTPSLYLGRAYTIEARALMELGRHEDALRSADRALTMQDEDAAEDATRVRAQCLAALGQRDQARATYLALIGATGNANPDDKAHLIALEGEKRASDIDKSIERAVKDARKAREKAAKAEGASIVDLASEGGVHLEGTLRRGKGPAAILFVPDAGGRRSVFTPYAQLFALDGISTLTLDPRGHGASRSDSIPSFALMPEHQRNRLPADVATGWRYLHEKLKAANDHIAVVAEGAACTTVERAIHEYGLSAAVVYLSPMFTEDDRELSAALSFRPPRPMLAVASEEDAFSMRTIWMLAELSAKEGKDARAKPATRVFRYSGHGVDLLHDPENFAAVSDWTRRAVKLPPE